MSETKFFICGHCGNLVESVNNSGVPIMCCGQKMTEIEPTTSDASPEKHLPVVKIQNNIVTVDVGLEKHPMQDEHSIQWVHLQTNRGGQRKHLKTTAEPIVTFALSEEKPIAVYSYCNLHGLWKTDI